MPITFCRLYVQHIFMEFCFQYFVILNDSTPFQSSFIFMCMVPDLKFNYDIISKQNHKGFTYEKCHKIICKITSIDAEDRQQNDYFVPVGIVAGHNWNSTLLDGTNTLKSILTSRRVLCFVIYVTLGDMSKLSQKMFNLVSIIFI